MDDTNYVKPLVAYLKDPEWVVRWIVAEKLGDIGDERAVTPLVELICDEDLHVKKNTVKALAKLGKYFAKELTKQFVHYNPEIRKQIASILISIGTEILPELEREILTNNNWVVSNRVVELLYRIGGPDAEDILVKAIEKPDVQKNAIVFLGLMKSKRSVPSLITAFKNSSARRIIIAALNQIGPNITYPIVVETFAAPSQLISQQAEDALLRIGKPCLPYVVIALGSSKNLKKDKLIMLLKKIDPKEVMVDIHKLAKKSPEVRKLTEDLRQKYPKTFFGSVKEVSDTAPESGILDKLGGLFNASKPDLRKK